MDKYEKLKRAWADHKRQEAAFAAGCGIMPGMPDMPCTGLANDFGDLVIEHIDELLEVADELSNLKSDIEAGRLVRLPCAVGDDVDPCDYCSGKGACNHPASCPDRLDYYHFEWRGPQEGANQ